jgi:hypothetical protein
MEQEKYIFHQTGRYTYLLAPMHLFENYEICDYLKNFPLLNMQACLHYCSRVFACDTVI